MTPTSGQPPTVMLVLIGLAVLGGLLVLNGMRKAARETSRAVSLFGRVLLSATVMVGVQWLVLTRSSDTTLKIVVLAVPALLAAALVTRALTVTTTTVKRGGRR